MIICDTHCDVLWMRGFEPECTPCVTMDNMQKGGISLQTCALFSGTREAAKNPYQTGMRQLEIYRHLRDHEGWYQVHSPLEAEEGKVRTMLSIEGGEVLEGSILRLEEFAEYGVRMIALTWNRENEIGSPACDDTDAGIKEEGWKLLRKMAELHIAADTSHLNEAGFYDLIDHHSQPPMASHSCAKALCGHYRNLTDDQIRKLASRGGWIGVNFCPAFLSEDGKATVSTLCDHIDHMCQLGAAGNVGLGSDFDGISHTPVGVSSPAEVPNIFEELRARGYSEEAVAGIAGLNFLRYYERLGDKKQL